MNKPDTELKYDIIIENTQILTMDVEYSLIDKGTLFIKEGKIEAIYNGNIDIKEYKYNKSINGSNKLVIPGLINTHTHSAMTVFRGIADDIPLQQWLYDYIFPLESKYVTKEMVNLGTTLAVMEMLRGGTTCFNDMYFYEDEVGKVAKKFGMRAIINESLIDYKAPNSATPEDAINYIKDLHAKYKDDYLIRVGVGAHAPYSCSTDLLIKSKQLAEDLGCVFNIHLAETKWEFELISEKHAKTPVAYLNSIGTLNKRTIGAHAVHLTEDDINILSKKEVKIAHNPQCNMKLASGIAPIPELINNNVIVGIGTDGVASNNNLDMFDELNTVALLHKINKNDPTTLNAARVIKMATIDGAKVLGLENIIGSIEVGKRADIVIIDLNKPHLAPCFNPYSLLAYSINSSDVESVIIDGKFVMENRHFHQVDEYNIIEEVRKFSNKIIKEGLIK